jgi:energy-coupling factor transporter ATP-binding protein EcfA2
MSVLEARGIAVALPGTPDPVVRGVSLAVRAGEWVALDGPNGSGKTTVALALAGLLPVREGVVLLDGHPLLSGAGTPRRDIATILQDPSVQLLQPTVAEELAFAARNLGQPAAEIDGSVARWAARFGLEADLGRDPRDLSAGRQQLVLLAAALVARPRFVIADEPGAHLDPGARADALRIVREAVDGGLGVVWVTQDTNERTAADRVESLGAIGGGPSPPRISPARDSHALLVLTIGPDPGAGPRVTGPVAERIVIPARGITALTGANATGKSVLLACACGLLHLEQIGVAWEQPPAGLPFLVAEHPDLTIVRERVEDETIDAAIWRGVDRSLALARARNLLERLGLARLLSAGRRSWSLSTGEKRIVSLVGGLIAPSGLLVLDEPTAGLDRRLRGELSAILIEVSHDVPILVASQDREWLQSLGARPIVLGDDPHDAPSLSKKTD